MAELFYKEEKYHDFMSACELVRRESSCYVSVLDTVFAAINRPARSFYLHPQEYSKIIKNGGRHLPKDRVKRELHLEILRRYMEIKTNSPLLKTHEIAKIIELQSAPRLYMSLRGATNLYYSLLKKRKL